ncbi:MAG: hypothetical protein VB140_05845 [Burkholderia sp.]
MRVNVNGSRSIYATTPFLLLTQDTAWVHCSAARLITQANHTFASATFANTKHAGAR